MSFTNPEALVSTEWLADHLSAPDVRVVDASYYLPVQERDARKEYQECHIPGAVFFDINDIADSNSPFPHMLPPPEKFSSKVRKLGIGDGNKVVIYDWVGGAMAAARVWWMFRFFGHNDVAILDGGMPKWLRERRQTQDLPPMPRERHFTSRVNSTLLRNIEQMKANLESKREQVIDARAVGRFKGSEPEPWTVKKLGHIPGSLNLPFAWLIDEREKTLLSADVIKEKIAAAGVDLSKPTVASCGSGVTACMLALAFYLVGNKEVAVYDGSWAEWGALDETPNAMG
jgi:thiosulfate/3-mercaptopyruvate sulfurtransferase